MSLDIVGYSDFKFQGISYNFLQTQLFGEVVKQRYASRMAVFVVPFKLMLFSLPFLFISAGSLAPTAIPSLTTEVSLAKSANVFVSADAPITITPGDSNKTIAKRALVEKMEHNKAVEAAKAKPVQTAIAPLRTVSTPDIGELRAIYQAAGSQFGVPWQVLEAIHQKETGKSGDTAVRSWAGATGPMQFMPGTWRSYAVDAGDGASITSVRDSIFTAAHYLRVHMDDSGSLDQAILSYNGSSTYVRAVKSMANELGANI